VIPTIDDRLSSMARALEEIILPALPHDQSLAVEQAQLMLGHLAVIREQLDISPAFEQAECNDLENLANALLDTAQGGARTAASTLRLRELTDAQRPSDAKALRDRTVSLSVAIEELIEASGIDGSTAFNDCSAELVIKSNDETTQRNRSFFRSMGFERGDVALPPIAELLDK
jgi:hypothetical protein